MTEAVICPCCGHRFVPPLPATPHLSDLAMAILTANTEAARQWRRGAWVSNTRWAAILFSNKESVRIAMQELVAAGYVRRVPVGKGHISHYLAIPTMMQNVERLVA